MEDLQSPAAGDVLPAVEAFIKRWEGSGAAERKFHEEGLVSVHEPFHDDLDAAVFDAFGWPITLTDQQILEKLVELNAERATPVTAQTLAKSFTRARADKVNELLQTLVTLGQARVVGEGMYLAG